MRDLKTHLGVSEQCGLCACHAKEVLEQALMQKSVAQCHIPQTHSLIRDSA
jgi:bacterioferritin-associated ferredoxin